MELSVVERLRGPSRVPVYDGSDYEAIAVEKGPYRVRIPEGGTALIFPRSMIPSYEEQLQIHEKLAREKQVA